MRSWRRFGLMVVAVTVGLVALVLSMLGAHWSEAPAKQAVVVAIPPLAVPPATDAAADLPPAPDAAIQRPDPPQNALVTPALQATSDPVLPDELALLPLESIEALKRSTADWESRVGPVAGAPSARSAAGGQALSPAQQSGKVPVQTSRPLQQVAADPAPPGSAAKIQVASQATTADDNSALPAGETRVFIHHVADQRDGALAQQLAEYLRGQGFTVADIRSVDFGIAKPSVRYFFARDRAASQRLVEELGRFSAGGASLAPDRASDFTHFVPKPRPGSVEVWLPGT
jgi:hypothetical protein